MSRFVLAVVASTGERFDDFAPYVPAISSRGVVAFQAALAGGATGIFASEGGEVRDAGALASGVVDRYQSHPDIDAAGTICVYATLRSGAEAVIRLEGGRATVLAETPARFASIGPLGPTTVLAETPARFASIGPLGPTMNDAGAVAFRADLASGGSGVFVARGGRVDAVAGPPAFTAFEGLPVVDREGSAVFRAERAGGGSVIARGGDVLVATGSGFTELARFPATNVNGAIAFAARRGDGSSGVFVLQGGELTCLADTTSGFESFRGALVDDAGRVVFSATPRGGALSVYAGTHVARDRIIGVGEEGWGSRVVELGLNPVSINGAGQLAMRLRLADDRQPIVRADP